MASFLKSHEIRLANTRKLIHEAGLSRTDAAEKIGMTYNLLSQYVGKNPTKKIGDDTAKKIEEAFEKPAGYLDQSEIVEEKPAIKSNFSVQEFLTKKGVTIKDPDSFDESEVMSAHVFDEEKDKQLFASVDVVDVSFSCGTGEAIEFHFDTVVGNIPIPYATFRKKGVHPSNVKVITAKGDSMSEKIEDGDFVGIDITQTEIIDGEIYAVYFAGEGMIKQLIREADGSITLHSLNPKYRDKIVTEENGANFRVIGKYFYRAG